MTDSNELEIKFQKCLNDFFNKVYRQWYIYNYLFSSKENVNILNRYENKIIMNLFQTATSDSIILGIQRIIDKTQSDDKENLTLHYFKQKLLTNTQKKVFGIKIKDIEIKFEKYKEYRHKKLGHHDLEYNKCILLNEDIEEIVKLIIEILNEFIKVFDFNKNKMLDFKGGIILGYKEGKDIVRDFIRDIDFLIKKSTSAKAEDL
ncbi:hypothetical protein CRV00_10095 [Malaciobacter molluscorum]|uniref:AbiU2 domain-containing protein n=1 Tax=Malaciobacter molluscorum TaxID=1032072 RepID=UPI00100C0B23|nr:hypothetical protein [Malaciobacter molluscorum]RXJ93597.1 hypothetical protein CRV00_10095 [Malaciobacter molluscorum]